RINRAHIEADAGKNIHDGPISKVDLNRAGTPLLEIVSEPDMRSAEDAISYLKKLHSIVRYIDISDANMQEGSFRVDVNVSIRPRGDEKLYTRVEIKNINSFRFIQRAIELEVARQKEAWEDGVYEQEIVQETRLFDQVKQETRSMRGKEEAADYRYFPEPDLLKVIVDDAMYAQVLDIPELPDAKKERFVTAFGLREYDAAVITADLENAHYFESMLECGVTAKNAVTWLTVELQGRLKGGISAYESPVSAKTLGTLVKRIEESVISGKAAKEVLDYLLENEGGDVDEVIEKLGLKQVSDTGALEALIDEILAANTDKVAEYKSGKDKLFGFFVGQAMKASKGSANPNTLNEILQTKLAQ
ncbi:MAG: Asp-tRNA(Asn)/Glu-tRNA(Gln) amidotransferase subunit GatB, partial [Sulfuricurvum sp.]|nr:Asp-tRNA(Asn)/Glu-tRNA(Gln) amidotransferase subunit GatB [Sulfuricurvum sp.]